MTVRGKIKNGRVLLDDPKALPDGTEVIVQAAKKARKPVKPTKRPRKKPKEPSRSFAERFRSFIGQAKGLPPDASINHDHYLYGLPKKQ